MPAAVPEAVPRYPGDVDEPNAGTVSPRLLVWREIRIVRGRRCTAAGGDVSYELLQFIGVLGAVCVPGTGSRPRSGFGAPERAADGGRALSV